MQQCYLLKSRLGETGSALPIVANPAVDEEGDAYVNYIVELLRRLHRSPTEH